MGTSSGAGNFRNNDGTAIDANSWQRLDDVPMTSTVDYVRQQVNSGTSYVEFGLQNTAETCIRDVSMVLAYHAAATSADNGKTSAFAGATETVVFSGDMSQTGLQYKSGVVAPTLPTWNQAAVNGLVARVGYSTDSSPNPYWDSIVLEVAKADAGVDTTPPATPGNLTAATASSTQVDLAWSASTDDVGVTGYQVERCQGASCANFALVSPVTGTSYADTGLTPSTVYRYRVPGEGWGRQLQRIFGSRPGDDGGCAGHDRAERADGFERCRDVDLADRAVVDGVG